MNATKSEVTEKYAASLEYHLLPQDSGQAVDYRYAVGEVNGWYGLFCRRCDADGSVSYSYQLIRDDNTVEFEPQNGRLPRVMAETYQIGSEAEESATEYVWVVRDASGEYLAANGRRTPASDEAHEHETREAAEAACERATDAVYRREVETDEVDADDYEIIEGMTIQHDASGQGHAWRDLLVGELPANIRLEIEAEIIDGGNDVCPDYVASNGLHYRW